MLSQETPSPPSPVPRPSEQEIIARIESVAQQIMTALMLKQPGGLESRYGKVSFECVARILMGRLESSQNNGLAQSVPVPRAPIQQPSSKTKISRDVKELLKDQAKLAGVCFILRFVHSRLQGRMKYRTFFADSELNCDPTSSMQAASRVMGLSVSSLLNTTQSNLSITSDIADSDKKVAAVDDSATGQPGGFMASPMSPQIPLQEQLLTITQMQTRILVMRHACYCKAPEDQCPVLPSLCAFLRQLYAHVNNCDEASATGPCTFPLCAETKYALLHYRDCSDVMCPVCIPVKCSVAKEAKRSLKRGASNRAGPPTTDSQPMAATLSNITAGSLGLAETLGHPHAASLKNPATPSLVPPLSLKPSPSSSKKRRVSLPDT